MKEMIIALSLALLIGCTSETLEHPYLGLETPGATPELFAPGLISTETEHEFGSVFNQAGTEFYYGVDVGQRNEIRALYYRNGAWTEPQVVLANDSFGYNDPMLDPTEQKLYYISNQSFPGKKNPDDIDIFYSNRDGDGWSAPVRASAINSDENEFYISFGDQWMYFGSNRHPHDTMSNYDIYRARIDDPIVIERLDTMVNSPGYEADVFVPADESYIIFCSIRRGTTGQGDLYISYRTESGGWTKARNMGSGVNTSGHELCPFVSSDGKYLFFTRNGDIYWMEMPNMTDD